MQEIHRGLLPGNHSNIQRVQTQDALPPPQLLQFKATATGKMNFGLLFPPRLLRDRNDELMVIQTELRGRSYVIKLL